MSRQILDNSDPSMQEEEFEQATELLEEEGLELARDLATEEMFDTQHGDGHTYNPQQAWEQGLTYTPPTDPPVVPGDGLENAEMAAGFSTSMEEAGPDEEILPARVDNNDDELAEDIRELIRKNSETAELHEITVQVENGVVTLLGTTPTTLDLSLVDDIVWDTPGVTDVQNLLEVAS